MRIFALLLFFVSSAEARDLGLIFENNRAVNKFKQERYLESYEELVPLLGQAPNDLLIQYNLATTFSANKEIDKAEKMYVQIIKETDPAQNSSLSQEQAQLRFASLFNLGNVFAQTQNVAKALDAYQKALVLVPGSKEVKTNIELLLSGQGKGKGKGKGKGESDKKDKSDKDGKGEGDEDEESDKPRRNEQTEEEKKESEKQRKKQKQMSMQDLKHILEELKQQEGKIRAKIQGKNKKQKGKEGPSGKQW